MSGSTPTRSAAPFPTTARLSIGRAGRPGRSATVVSTHDQLQFQLDHARARDAVHDLPDFGGLLSGIQARGMDAILLDSAVPAGSRQTYLRRPDLGRRLSPRSAAELQDGAKTPANTILVIADGLSALAIDRHALPVLDALTRAGLAIEAPVSVVRNGRVAIGDEIGEILQAEMAILLIGERPGLSAPDSLGVYLTSHPRIGRTDAERNCISNIRLEGLGYDEAAHRIAFYLGAAREQGGTGYALKDSSTQTFKKQVSPNLPAIS